MFNIYIIEKSTKKRSVLDTVDTERKAERFCEMWGWSYDDGEKSYWLEYEEVKLAHHVIIDGWKVFNDPHGFRACKDGKVIWFTAEYKNGTYFKIKYYNDGTRNYYAERYFYKLIGTVQMLAFELLKQGMLWDYKNDCNALESYKKGIRPYYEKCIANNLPLYDDADFLNNLFNENGGF